MHRKLTEEEKKRQRERWGKISTEKVAKFTTFLREKKKAKLIRNDPIRRRKAQAKKK